MAGLAQRQGAGLAVIAECSSSPTLARLRRRLQETWPQAQWAEYEPLTDDQVRAGSQLAFGGSYRTSSNLQAARIILAWMPICWVDIRRRSDTRASLPPGATGNDETMNRLYVVESAFSVTGAAADHRLPLRSGQIGSLLGRLREVVAQLQGGGDNSELEVFAGGQVRTRRGGRSDLAPGSERGGGRPAATAGGARRGTPAERSVGERRARRSRIRGSAAAADRRRSPHWPGGARAMHDGTVDTLLILGGNPVYNAPADLNFAGGAEQGDDVGARRTLSRRDGRSCASGMCRRLISSNRGETLGRTTVPTASCSR